jgi:hypothetical protein
VNFIKMSFYAVASAAFVMAGRAQGASLVNVAVLGFDATAGQSSYGSSVSGNVGDTINYEIVAFLSPSGTANGTRTLGTQVVGTDGLSGTNLDLTGGSAISNLTATLASFYSQGLGAGAGTVSSTGATNIRPLANTGSYAGADQADQAVVLTGSFALQAAGSVAASYDSTDNQGGVLETFLTSGPGTGYPKQATVSMNQTSETGSAPYEAFAGLNLSLESSPVPSPATIPAVVLIATGLFGVGAVRRRIA